MRFSGLVSISVLLEAGFFFYVASWMTWMYRHLHASWLQALVAGEPDYLKGLLLVAVGVLYWRVARARPFLRILAIAAAVVGMYDFQSVRGIVVSYSGVFRGDIVAISAVSAIWLVVIGALAVADHYAGKTERERAPWMNRS